MYRKLTLLVAGLFCLTFAFAQSSENVNGPVLERTIKFKPQNPDKDKIDMVTVTATKGATFTTSNTADGTKNSFNHSLRIILPLVTSNKANEYQLVFYSESEDIPYAVGSSGNVLSLYYPISTYASIKEKLDLAIAGHKNIQLKVTQKTDGYREASLVF